MSYPISTWMRDVLPRTPGANRKVLRREFVLTCREFFTQSCTWRALVEGIDLVGGTASYTVPSPDATGEIFQIATVEYAGRPLTPLVRRPVTETTPTGTPTCWYPNGTNSFTLWPTPENTEDDAVRCEVFLTLVDTATMVPDIAYQRFYDVLLDGVLGRMFSHPMKPYSSPDLGTYHLKRFRSAMSEFTGMAKQGFINGQNWVYPGFGK